MTNLILHVRRLKPFPHDTEAVVTLAALAEVLARSSLRGGLWTQLSGVRPAVSARAFEHGLAAARGIRADLPGQPTHVFPVHSAARRPTEIGTLSIAVRDPAPEGSFPGLSALIALPDDVFDARPAALQSLLERCADAAGACSAMIGPRQWVRGEGAAWATFAPDVPRDRVPADSRIVEARKGWLIVAHAEDPTSVSPGAREAALRVRDALSSVVVSTPNPTGPVLAAPSPSAGTGARREPAGRSGTVDPAAPPSFMASRPPAVRPSVTLAMEARPAVEPIPFDPTAEGHALPSQGPQRQSGLTGDVDANAILRGALAAVRPRGPGTPASPGAASPAAPPASPGPRQEIGQTVDVDVAAIARRVLSFGPAKPAARPPPTPETAAGRPARPAAPARAAADSRAPAAPRVPRLTLHQYASLCVDLELAPAQSAAILHRYGADEAGKRILDEGWARTVREQPAARAALAEAKERYRAWLSRGGRDG